MSESEAPKMSGLTEYSTAGTNNDSPHESLPSYMLMPDGTPDYLKLILTSKVYEVCNETPISPAVNLSSKLGTNIFFKREDLQPVFSFKLRGAYNMIANLAEESRWKGVIACSAGNHAQGVAYSAKHLQIPATIVMPTVTPAIKYKNVDRLGAKVVLHGDDFDAAKAECSRIAEQHGLENIPPFDNPYVIAGQGTIGLELLRQLDVNKLKAVFVCIGGGGLIAGIGAYLKRIAPHVKVIGVETYDAHAMKKSLDAGKRVTLKEVGLFADGAAVKIPGEETFRICKEVVDEIILVSTDEICAAIKDVFNETRSIVEPAGALSVAGLIKYIDSHPEIDHSNNGYCSILSGANMDFDRLRFVSERAKLGEGSEMFIGATIPERPGSFESLMSVVHPRAVTEFSYRYSIHQADINNGKAHIYLSFSVKDAKSEAPRLLEQFKEKGIEAVDISENELAKSHARYLVGGKANVPNERLIRFEFPERPGALIKFLHGVRSKWNISLFHYRNHGSDIARVLAGISVPTHENDEFQKFLHNLDYPFVEETDNVAYKLFLKGNE